MILKVKPIFDEPPQRDMFTINQEMNNNDDTLFKNDNKDIKANIELLINMGFDKEMINKVYILLKPENVEKAISYMIKINGIYQHNFFENINFKNINSCFICKQPRKNHLDYPHNDKIDKEENNNIIDFNKSDKSHTIMDLMENSEIQINNNTDFSDICEVCYGEITDNDRILNILPCGHLFCSSCWTNYLKSLILESKVDNIKCMNYQCKKNIPEEFILNHISEHKDLIEKFHKFKNRKEILKDQNKKVCPNPDCESFLKKSLLSKYVKCEKGHEYCFECLNPPHGNKPCDYKQMRKFMKWKKGKRVKQCPKCKMYTEKNEGCNHMTCGNCNYQWCWLCEEEYKGGHYSSGKCRGQQNTRADNIEEIEKLRKMFGLHKIFTCVFPEIEGPLNFEDLIKVKYVFIILFWIFGFALLFSYVSISYFNNRFFLRKKRLNRLIIISIIFGFTIFIPFQFLFTCIITPFIIISLIHHHYFEKILLFFGIGQFEVLD